jgi:raffinose/stachyose/melibiose transport system substrate-binding protein
MKKFTKLSALALASTLSLTVLATAPTASAATCTKKTTVEMLGTIKPEIQTEFLAAVKAYNS